MCVVHRRTIENEALLAADRFSEVLRGETYAEFGHSATSRCLADPQKVRRKFGTTIG
jgi:hypothetical protein